MAGIDRIVSEIQSDAEKEAAKIITAAEDAAKKQEADTQAKCDAEKADSDKLYEKELAREEKKTRSQCEQIEKLILLETRQSIIEDILIKAKAKILIQEKSEYFETILKLLAKSTQPEKGEILFNEKDLGRLPEDFEKKINEVATRNGGTLSISKDVAPITGGFILRYGNIEINSSIDAIFEENKEVLTDTVKGILWQ
jgi:V/A-type H+-transporting ATPase subunit E